MIDLIDRQEAIKAVMFGSLGATTIYGRTEQGMTAQKETVQAIRMLPSSDAVDVVRCKDCKHRPTGEIRDDLEFPDDKCPCKCEDYWYSWKPSDNWFCGNGERKDSNYRGERKYG